jgi:hypothetical protein
MVVLAEVAELAEAAEVVALAAVAAVAELALDLEVAAVVAAQDAAWAGGEFTASDVL